MANSIGGSSDDDGLVILLSLKDTFECCRKVQGHALNVTASTMKYVQNREDVSNWQCLTLIVEDVTAKVPVDSDAGKAARL